MHCTICGNLKMRFFSRRVPETHSEFAGGMEPKACGIGSHSWLLFCDDAILGAKLTDFLKRRGEIAALVHLGHKYSEREDGSCEIDATSPNDYLKLCRNRPLSGGA